MDKLFVNAFSGKEFPLHVYDYYHYYYLNATLFYLPHLFNLRSLETGHISNTVRNYDKDTYKSTNIDIM